MSSTSSPASDSDFMYALIRTAYLPSELPPLVTTKSFASFCRSQYVWLSSQTTQLGKIAGEVETFSAPRTNGARRQLSVVNPICQLRLSLAITQYRNEISSTIKRSTLSLYSTQEDLANDRAFSGLDFESRYSLQAKIASEYPYFLRADISRFFYTIYTHSIPWAIHGKEQVKTQFFKSGAAAKKKIMADWTNAIDSGVQACQSRETFGLPVGPDTSRIIAELILSGVEQDPDFASMITGRPSYRLVDDYIIGFKKHEDAQAAERALRRALWRYNLQLNETKTGVFSTSLLVRERWRLELGAMSISCANEQSQAIDLHRMVDQAYHLCRESENSAPASWVIHTISRTPILPGNWPIALDAVLRMARDFPAAMNRACVFLINNQPALQSAALLKRISLWTKQSLQNHAARENDYETGWLLLTSAAYGFKVTQEEIGNPSQIPSPIIFTIIGLLNEKKLTTIPLSTWKWRQIFPAEGIYGRNWLPLYEAVRRKWTTDKTIASLVNSDQFFQKMLQDQVTFLDLQPISASAINLKKRTYKKAAGKTNAFAAFGIPLSTEDYET